MHYENYDRPTRHYSRPPKKAAGNAGQVLNSREKQIENN